MGNKVNVYNFKHYIYHIGSSLIIIVKYIVFVLLVFMCFSCVIHKPEELEREKKTQKLLEFKKVKVHLPKNWIYRLDHNSIAYSPKKDIKI